MPEQFTIRPVFSVGAARKFLSGFHNQGSADGDADAGANSRVIMEEAMALFWELIDNNALYACHLLNTEQRNAEQVVELIFATDADNETNGMLAERLDNRTLIIKGKQEESRGLYNTPGASTPRSFDFFVVDAFFARGTQRGDSPNWSKSALIRFVDLAGSKRVQCGLSAEFLAGLAALPLQKQKQVEVETRLADWRGFLELLERQARQRQFTLSYRALRIHTAGNRLMLSLAGEVSPEQWLKVRAAIGQDMEIAESNGDLLDEIDPIRVGMLQAIDEKNGQMIILLNDDSQAAIARNMLDLPKKGRVHYNAMGDLSQVRLLTSGLDRLSKGRGRNSNLSEFLFDANQARLPIASDKIVLQAQDLLMQELSNNAPQLEAVTGALNAPDLFLIQGPPGTGKTTVIAELCYQIARRGGRTLVASQSNLAVDNALSKLAHHPAIRALRRGHADRVEDEGKDFLEENVIGSWLGKTADSAADRIQQQQQRLAELEGGQRAIQAFITFCQDGRKLAIRSQQAQSELDRIQKTLDDLANERLAADAQNQSWQGVRQSLCQAATLGELCDVLNRWVEQAETRTSRQVISQVAGAIQDQLRKHLLPVLNGYLDLTRQTGLAMADLEAFFGQVQPATANMGGASGSLQQSGFEINAGNDIFASWQRNLLQVQRLSEEISQALASIRLDAILNEHQNAIFTRLTDLDGRLQIYANERQTWLQRREQVVATQQAKKQDWIRQHGSALVQDTGLLAYREIIPAQAFEQALAQTSSIASVVEHERKSLASAAPIVRDWVARLQSLDPDTEEELRETYIDHANVIGVTCVQAGRKKFSEDYADFDCVIIDEVSKATPPELLLPMLKGSKVVLVGDHKQLPPLVGDDSLEDYARETGKSSDEYDHLKWSLFKELFETAPPDLKSMLIYQYRMHPQIMNAINQFYDNKLESKVLDPDRRRAHGMEPVVTASTHIQWLTTPVRAECMEERVGSSFKNERELLVIEELLEQLDQQWGQKRQMHESLPRKDVGLITFYAAQVREMQRRFQQDVDGQPKFPNLTLRVGTVDRFQGMERAIVIVSLVRNNSAGEIGFARKPERINVALSRAQELLVIVGSQEMFCEKAKVSNARQLYRRVAQTVEAAGGMRYV